MHDDVYRSSSLFVLSSLTCVAISSRVLENIVLVFGILIFPSLFVPVWVVDVKYPFCSQAAGLKWEGSGRSCSIRVISILKARHHQTFGGLGCINQTFWNKQEDIK